MGAADALAVLRLAVLYDEVATLLATFAHVSLHWILRYRNGEADALARTALGLLLKEPVKLTEKKRRR